MRSWNSLLEEPVSSESNYYCVYVSMCIYGYVFLKHCTFQSVKNVAHRTHAEKVSTLIFSLHKLLNYSKCSFECERSEKEKFEIY